MIGLLLDCSLFRDSDREYAESTRFARGFLWVLGFSAAFWLGVFLLAVMVS